MRIREEGRPEMGASHTSDRFGLNHVDNGSEEKREAGEAR